MKTPAEWADEDERRGAFAGTDSEWRTYVLKNIRAIQIDCYREFERIIEGMSISNPNFPKYTIDPKNLDFLRRTIFGNAL
jgi:hypothetical protein